MTHYLLDQSFRTPEGGIAAHRVVTRGSSTDDCLLPTAANVGNILGISTHSQPRAGRYVGVRRLGIATATAAGAIERGVPVAVADDEGRIAAVPYPAYDGGNVGANSGFRIEWLDRESFSPGIIISIHVPEENSTFEWSFLAGELRIIPDTEDETISMNAGALVQAINDDAELSKFVRASLRGGSTGSGIPAAGAITVANLGLLLNPIGIAEEAATQAGDLVNVFLKP